MVQISLHDSYRPDLGMAEIQYTVFCPMIPASRSIDGRLLLAGDYGHGRGYLWIHLEWFAAFLAELAGQVEALALQQQSEDGEETFAMFDRAPFANEHEFVIWMVVPVLLGES